MGCGYLGYFGTLRLAYLYKQSTWFSYLEKQDAARLRGTTQALMGFELSNMSIQNSPASLQNNVSNLTKIRSRAPPEVWPILDLRLAKDYAMMARLEQQAGSQMQAAGHQQSAKMLLGSLGWQNVSDDALNDLADKQLRLRLKP
jgi:hypothetical protein